MKQNFIDYLATKGVATNGAQNDVLTFAMGGVNFMCAFDPSDRNYVQILIPDIEPAQELSPQIKERAAQLTSEVKVGKILILQNQVWISVESFVYSKENVSNLYDRMLGVALELLRRYRNQQNEQA